MENADCIFVIDDDTASLRMLKGNLVSLGLTVYTFREAKKAMVQVRKLNPRVIITDIFMPEMDGFEVIKNLRSTGYSGMIISMSQGSARLDTSSMDVLNISKIFGADEAFTKPVDFEQMRRPIEQYQQSHL